MIFKCKNCGGNAIYSPEHRGMYCPYCESEKSEERKYDLYNITICPDCSGELKIDVHTSALECPYCNNSIILNERVEGEFEQQKIIPFAYSKKAVKDLLKAKFKKCIFAPTDFLSEAKLNSMRGEYIPFWMYDYNAHCTYRGEGVKVRTWRTGNIEHTETSYYDVVRDMNVLYSDIPVDASMKMPDNIMDLLEPYQYGAMVDFQPEYMSGFDGEKYNMAAGIVENRANAKMKASAEKIIQNTVNGYLRVNQHEKNVSAQVTDTKYCLLPVWKYIYKYNDVLYPFYINGQTGKVVGKVPISKKKVFAYGATLWGILTFGILMLGGILTL